ncbi:MAG: N-glycosylase/DNA lyase [Candidatus Aenigmarchaeota archaeon]|nr:N-glycosylase/DNA lyase [Candidatus Aenigmarchaeota archaeon]
MNNVIDLKQLYEQKKDEITTRLTHFKQIYKLSDEHIFQELSFCLCTPQSSAKSCDKAIKGLMQLNLLYAGTAHEIAQNLFGVRFHNNKSRYIVLARDFFTKNNKITIKQQLDKFNNIFELRDFLVNNIKGMGMKEASHFLRNIGKGDNLAILDRHILKNLQHYGAITHIPKTISNEKYEKIESDLREFSKNINIPPSHLDLLFWSKETGEIFK